MGWVCARCKIWHNHEPVGICVCFRPRPPVEPFPAPPSRLERAQAEAMIDFEYAKARAELRRLRSLAAIGKSANK